ncbi:MULTISPECIES: C40 family peptidase [Kitasatospora]|uniref:Putative peptidase C40 family protein n=1 Tax=Kitasatospora setae (strain ATCC 33774 / DSM 43861 / JCM 3304 / KCC A-0304 / NBRC 14216 / KM-6054) TaxID=452652 RepID=E4N9W7_KITSK|nr:C40 family peptidase [Kitasatospora setae]BAJ27998.1 putative peptidase C40 family protein [Kitasatospora setae KM-6054]
MASHRRPKPASRARVSILTATAAAAVALSAQGGAHADPAPTKDQVKQQVDQLNEEAEIKTEALNASVEKQQDLQKQVGQLQDQLARQQGQVTTVQESLAGIAAEQYRTGSMPQTMQLMLSSTPDAFLGQAGALNVVGSTQADLLKSFKDEQSKLDAQRKEAESKLAELDTTTKALQADKADVQAKLAKAQELLNTLTQQEREQIAAAEAKAAADAKAKADAAASAASAASQDRASRSTDRPALDAPAPSNFSGNAVGAAVSKLGSWYAYGAAGPSSFDCSGLMQWAYKQAGVSIPRTSQAQAGAGTSLGTDIANARPGDLIIYYGDQHHVGMYVGNGQMIHAPHTGAQVRYESATAMPINRIVRI